MKPTRSTTTPMISEVRQSLHDGADDAQGYGHDDEQ
jgi:hypothetical protein